jgi:hypothetical protein
MAVFPEISRLYAREARVFFLPKKIDIKASAFYPGWARCGRGSELRPLFSGFLQTMSGLSSRKWGECCMRAMRGFLRTWAAVW